MIKKVLFILILLIVLVFISLLVSKQPSNYNEAQNITEVTPLNSKNDYRDWKTYVNYRFNYLIRFPSDWQEGRQAENNDGRALYQDDNGNEVLVYASYSPSPFSVQESLNKELFTFNNGQVATLVHGISEGEALYIVFFTKDDTQYIFYAKGSSDFIDSNRKILEQTAKSLESVNLVVE